jgi:hypothetical protein
MPIAETLETSQALHDKVGIDTGPVFANAILHKLLTPKEKETLEKVMEDEDPSELKDAASEVGLRIDGDDLNALVGYEKFLEARRAIQAKHLRELRRGLTEPVVELPFLFSAGLELPDVETLADVAEKEIDTL